MNIGGAASASRVSAKIFHHYEAAGLIAGDPYRKRLSRLHPADVVMLQFIRQARDPAFSIERIRRLVDLGQSKRRASADVKRAGAGA